MILFICEPPGFWNHTKPVNVQITTVNDFDNDGKPRQTVTIETVDPDKEKRERDKKIAKNILVFGLFFLAAFLFTYAILYACGIL